MGPPSKLTSGSSVSPGFKSAQKWEELPQIFLGARLDTDNLKGVLEGFFSFAEEVLILGELGCSRFFKDRAKVIISRVGS